MANEAHSKSAKEQPRDESGRVQPKAVGGPEGPRTATDTKSDGSRKNRERDDVAKACGVSPTTAKRTSRAKALAPIRLSAPSLEPTTKTLGFWLIAIALIAIGSVVIAKQAGFSG